jgi:saxitoxin biosynthesis operon SxtJ-like protein
MEARVPARLSPAEGRRFGFTLGAAFSVLGGLLWWRGREPATVVALGLACVLLLAGLVVPSRLEPVRRAWLGLGAVLSHITTPIFMGVVYFGVIAPIGLLLRIRGRNPLQRHRSITTCWVPRPEAARSRRDMARQF